MGQDVPSPWLGILERNRQTYLKAAAKFGLSPSERVGLAPTAPPKTDQDKRQRKRDGILGRVDDMKLIRGTNVYPRAVEAVVREHSEVEEFQIIISRRDDVQDEITVKVELKPDQKDVWPRLQAQLGKDLADAHEGLRFNVELAAQGELPRFELKAKRLQDLRPQY